MSRNKENNPLPSHTRANGSVFGLSKTTPGDEFFTDSILEDTSRIPSPSPHKHLSSKPRRAFQRTQPLKSSRNAVNTRHRSSSPNDGAERKGKHTQPAPTLQRPKNLQTTGSDLITPPQSRDGPPLASPMSDVSSPPRGLTETYQRIDEEEELAGQERESGEDSDETDLPEDEDVPQKAVRVGSSKQSQSSRGQTPVMTQREIDQQNRPHEHTQASSEASGMSFLDQLTDQNLAAKMTPSVQESARDKKRLQKFAPSKPILFNQGPKPSEQFPDEVRSNGNSSSSKSRIPQSFRMATKSGVNGMTREGSDASSKGRPQLKAFAKASTSEPKPESEDIRPKTMMTESVHDDDDLDEGDETSDELRGAEHQFLLNQMKKQRAGKQDQVQRQATETTDQKSTEPDDDDVAIDDNSTQHSQPSNKSDDARPLPSKIPQRNNVPSTNKGVFNMWRRKTGERQTERNQSFSSQGSSQVDWANVGADVALPSVEEQESLTPQQSPPRHEAPDSVRSTRSQDKMRPWDNDFTSNSFQVSESPPVRNIRSKKSMEDYVREKEMEHLTKQAVTTNRLDAIREKDPKEAQRRLSRSPSARLVLDNITDPQVEDAEAPTDVMGEPVPDTPVVIYRSSSSSSRNSTKPEKPGHDRQTSHDHIQRLTRALSTTPKSSPAPTAQNTQTGDWPDQNVTKDSLASSANAPEVIEQVQSQQPSIAVTPRVTGAWTDTILPDTVKTVKQTGTKAPTYAQTPHVSAGGWVDTPMATGMRQSSALAPMTIEEVTEELDTDVVQKSEAQPISNERSVPLPAELSHAASQIPRSAVQSIIDQQKQRLVSADITSATRPNNDDTLALGDATIASLQDLIDDTQDEISAMIQKGAEHDAKADLELLDSDAAFVLERMGSRLVDLKSQLSLTRKGLSKLEHQVSHPTKATGADARQLLEQTLASTVAYPPKQSSNSFIPLVYSTVTLPLPLLFHPRQKSTKSTMMSTFGRPTLLGYLVLTFWVWYIVEVILSELYSHPLHAEVYEWPPLDRPEPSFGFCLPTLFLRLIGVNARFDGLSSLLWAFTQPVYVLLRAFFRVIGMWVGWTDGFVDDGREVIRNATKLVRSAAAVVTGTNSGGDGWSMMDDEIL